MWRSAPGKVDELKASDLATKVQSNVANQLVALSGQVELILVALLAGGHALLEDVPGVGKTSLARAVAASLGLGFRRIQFTPDMLPGDITGSYYFNQRTGEWLFREGPILTNVLLADEINRASPRTQSALLEAMQERQVTVEGETRQLPSPFLVIATQNPVELEGTFPLPEAQLDRFLLRLSIGYPDEDHEREILLQDRPAPTPMEPVVEPAELSTALAEAGVVNVEESIAGYISALVRATRSHPAVELGASPRASLALQRGCRALAALRGRAYVLPDDVKQLAVPVLAHRLVLQEESRLRGQSAASVVEELRQRVAVPAEV